MALKLTVTEAYDRGRKMAEQRKKANLALMMENDFIWTRNTYLGAKGLDLREALVEFAAERMAAELDLAKYPECRGLREVVEAERNGFTDVREYIGYLNQYKDFWGPGNQLWTDPELNFAAIEKANVRMGVRYTTGCCAITACACLIPEMNAFKKERDLLSFQARGWSVDDNPDKAFWDGAEARYHRLLDLVQQEYDHGATLLGAAQIALDHKVPFPARVCIAGQRGHKDEPDGMQNWTLLTSIRLLSGPNLRAYNWVIDPDNPRPIYETECILSVGEGLESRRPEWQAEVRAAGEIGR